MQLECFCVFSPIFPGQWAAHWSWIPTASVGRPSGWQGNRLSCARRNLRLYKKSPKEPDWVCVSASTNSVFVVGTAPATANILGRSYNRVSGAGFLAWVDYCPLGFFQSKRRGGSIYFVHKRNSAK